MEQRILPKGVLNDAEEEAGGTVEQLEPRRLLAVEFLVFVPFGMKPRHLVPERIVDRPEVWPH